MKKLMVAFCGAALAAVAFAQEPAASAEAREACGKCCAAKEGVKAKAEAKKEARKARAERGPRGMQGRPRQNVFVINDKTTAEQLEAYKKQVCERIDAAAKAYADKQVADGEKKMPVRVMLNVIDRPFGRPGMEGGRRGPHGDRPRRGPAPDAK